VAIYVSGISTRKVHPEFPPRPGTLTDAVTPDVLAAIEPSLTFVDGAASKPGEASVYAGRSGALGVAVMSGSGTCFWIMNPGKGEQRYGSGMPCSGRAALQASQADW
jgi:hypothetical protein